MKRIVSEIIEFMKWWGLKLIKADTYNYYHKNKHAIKKV